MSEAQESCTPLRATFKIILNGKAVSVGTVGEAYRVLTSPGSVEWMEFRSLHQHALTSLQDAAGDAMLTVQATNALRVLFARAKLL
jgi:hypothetical protein